MELMNTRLIKKSWYNKKNISGLAARCDWFIDQNNIVKLKDIENPKIIFLTQFRGNINIKFFVNDVLPTLKNKFNLIIASEDYTFPSGNGDLRINLCKDIQNEIQILLNNNYLNFIFVENLDSKHPKLKPIPLGLLKYKHDYKIYKYIITKPVDYSNRNINVLCCHKTRYHKQWNDRKMVTSYCKTIWKDFVTYYDYIDEKEFHKYLLNSKFCLCVHGGGYDPSPKAWEALCCGCIPIIENSPIIKAYINLPVIIVKKWTPECLSKEILDNWFEKLKIFYLDKNRRNAVLNMLTLNYWWNIINSSIE